MKNNLMLLGPPGTGKASALLTLFAPRSPLYIDLENWSLLGDLLKTPNLFKDLLASIPAGEPLTINRVDRIGKYWPLLLKTIEEKNFAVAATACYIPDSASDKWTSLFKHRYFSALDFFQIKDSLVLSEALTYGTLPEVYNLEKSTEKIKQLKTYAQGFLDAELLSYDHIRNLVPFHLFLPLAAEQAGNNLNLSWLSQNLDVSYKTIQHYFNLFVRHYVGFYLPAFPQQVRKVQLKRPRFYFFDTGFQRALGEKLDYPLQETSAEYENLFKCWMISQVHQLIQKRDLPVKMYYLETKDGVGIDLILVAEDGALRLIQFSTAKKILPVHLKSLSALGKDMPRSEIMLVTPENYVSFFNQIFRTAQDDK